MTTLLLPTTRLVAVGWLQLALPGVGVGTILPPADDELRTVGFVRIAPVGGSPDAYVPMRMPVVQAECWTAPVVSTGKASRSRAEQLANRILAATYDEALQGAVIDLSPVGSFAPARVHTVTAMTEPGEVEGDTTDWSRFDLDIELLWSAA